MKTVTCLPFLNSDSDLGTKRSQSVDVIKKACPEATLKWSSVNWSVKKETVKLIENCY